MGSSTGPAMPEGDETDLNSQGVTSRKVLIIEDDPISARLLGRYLGMLGHEVETTREGQAGLEKVHDFAPDALICDIRLPDRDGWSIARELNESSSSQRPTLLIALTSLGGDREMEQSRQAGFDLHMVKPPDLEKLRQIVSSLLV